MTARPSHLRSSTYRPDIEGLRGLAVLFVVAFHCGVPGISGGFIGVDVFFVLSGYLITGLLAAEFDRTGRLSLIDFYARRARRLLPAAALALVCTLIGAALVLAPHELRLAARAGRATAVYLSNMFFAVNAADYFSPAVENNPVLHTWSLAVEEQFYFVWPLLMLVGLRTLRTRRTLLLALAGVSAISLAASIVLTPRMATFAFYSLPTRAWEFGAGGLGALVPVAALAWSTRNAMIVRGLGLAAVVSSASLLSGQTGFPGWVAMVPVAGTVAALAAGAAGRGDGSRLLDVAPLQFLGTMSYSWYLWHWPFLVLAAALVPGIGLAGKLLAAGLALVVAAVTHHVVENPIRFHPALVRRPLLSLGLAGLLTATSFGSAVLSGRTADRLAQTPELRFIDLAAADIADMPRAQCVSLGGSRDVKTCEFGAASSPVHVVLFGDSHAIQWFNAVRRAAEARHWKLTTVVKSGCGAVDVEARTWPESDAAECRAWRRAAVEQVVAMRPTVVVLGSATMAVALTGRRTERTIPLAEWEAGARRTLTRLTDRGLRVVAMRDTPHAPFDVPTCLARSVRLRWLITPSCDIAQETAVDGAVFEAEQRAADGLPGVDLADFTDRFCAHGVCPAMRDGLVVYRDDNHLTGRFAASLAPALEHRMAVAVGNSR